MFLCQNSAAIAVSSRNALYSPALCPPQYAKLDGGVIEKWIMQGRADCALAWKASEADWNEIKWRSR